MSEKVGEKKEEVVLAIGKDGSINLDRDLPKGEEEVSLSNYVLRYAKNLDPTKASSDVKDDDIIPDEAVADTYHLDRANEAKAEINEIENDDNPDKLRNNKLIQENSLISSKRAENEAKITRYGDVISKLENWQSSDKYQLLKNSLISELTEAVSNLNRDMPQLEEIDKSISAQKWLNTRVIELYRLVAFHKEEYQKELDKVEARNAWVLELKASLNQ